MKTIRHLLIACCLPALAACSDRGVEGVADDLSWGPREIEMCRRQGGYEDRGFLPFCQFDTADAGRACRGFEDCEGECLGAPRGSEGPPPGTRVTGQCSDVRSLRGCYSMVEDGVVKGDICVD